jgi:hypothetical protein
MGEKSKKRGEFGEKVVEELLALIGWEPLITGRDIECICPTVHQISKTERKTHGIDFTYQYDCPLFNNRQQFVLISAKYTDNYPSNPNSIFKSHIKDIAFALECFKKSSLRNELKIFGKDYEYTGVIFWLDNGKECQFDDVIERLANFKIDSNLELLNRIYLVDNKRANFLYAAMNFAKHYFKKNEEDRIEFLIPNIGYNSTLETRKTSSIILPVQYINSSILPLKIFQKKNTEILVLNVIDNFEKESLQRLISLAQKLTEGWGSKVYILFPEFNKDKYGETVEEIKSKFIDKTFICKIKVDTFNKDFRNV